MLLYSTLGANDLKRAVRFYDDGYGFRLCPPFDGQAAPPGNGTMLAFRAQSAAQVRAFHAAGLAHGGTDEGAPGTRPDYGPDFYVADLRDPDGNKFAAVFHRCDPEADTPA